MGTERAAAESVEIKVLASVALTSALDEIAPQFERATGNKLTLGYSLIADIKKRILAGETADLIILSRPAMDDLQKENKIASGSMTDIVGTPIAIGVKAGAPKPDISSVDALKRSLLAAKSIVYADPAKGGASGVYFARVVDQLGLTEQLKSKTILVPGAQAAEVLAKGRGRDRRRAGVGNRAGSRRATGRTVAGRIQQRDEIHRRPRRRQQGDRGREGAGAVSQRPGGVGGVQVEGAGAGLRG